MAGPEAPNFTIISPHQSQEQWLRPYFCPKAIFISVSLRTLLKASLSPWPPCHSLESLLSAPRFYRVCKGGSWLWPPPRTSPPSSCRTQFRRGPHPPQLRGSAPYPPPTRGTLVLLSPSHICDPTGALLCGILGATAPRAQASDPPPTPARHLHGGTHVRGCAGWTVFPQGSHPS